MGREMVQDLRQDADIGSDLYKTLEESKLCDTVGYVAIPECAAKNEGDECAAKKTEELIKKPLRLAIKAEKIKEMPSGQKFFAYCKHIGYKNVLATFKRSRSLMSVECGLPGQEVGNRKKRNTELLPALLLAGSYDPSSIWFQYFLCKDIDLYCYFFTQGWTQGQYGQYYLYDNLLDDNTGLFAGSSDSSNLATIALLGGLGGGIGQPSGYYPSYGAHAAAPVQGRKRRQADDDDQDDRKRRDVDDDLEDDEEDRRRRDVDDDDDEDDRKRRDVDDADDDDEEDRKRRSTVVDCKGTPSHPDCHMRRRRTINCEGEDRMKPICTRRKRRTAENACNENNPNDPNCNRRKRSKDDCANDESCDRKRRDACKACVDNPDSTDCHICREMK